MSKAQLLVAYAQGRVRSDRGHNGKRWDISGPRVGAGNLRILKGSPADPNRVYASQSTGWFGQIIQRSNDGGETWEPVGNQFAYEGAPGTHQSYDGTPHPFEFKRGCQFAPSLTEPDTVYAEIETPPYSAPATVAKPLARAASSARPWFSAIVAARWRRFVPAHHHSGSGRPAAHFHRHFGRGRVPHRRRRHHLAANQPRPALRRHPRRPERRSWPLRPSDGDAPGAARRVVHAEALGRDAQRRRRRVVAGDQRQSAFRLRLRDRCSRA